MESNLIFQDGLNLMIASVVIMMDVSELLALIIALIEDDIVVCVYFVFFIFILSLKLFLFFFRLVNYTAELDRGKYQSYSSEDVAILLPCTIVGIHFGCTWSKYHLQQ